MASIEHNNLLAVEGTIQRVDILAREVLILVHDDLLYFDIPVTCLVYVNEERVKLRLLQPMDHVLIQYRQEAGRAVAESVQVRP